MNHYRFRILNVFAETRFGGNPLCVFEDARGMDDATMQALALQFNLSETTFIFPSERADARVRIFTPGYEMVFAGHPTLGTAHVVRDLLSSQPGRAAAQTVTLEYSVGLVPVVANGDHWTLTAPFQGQPKTSSPDLSPATMAGLLGLSEDDLLGEPVWVNTGTDQLLVPLRSADAVNRALPDAGRLNQWPASSLERKSAYVFALTGEHEVLARYFFSKQGGGVSEDPGTGSACANLGGWLIKNHYPLPAHYVVQQGEMVERPCRLTLDVSAEGAIRVGGNVIELGRGSIDID